MIEVLVIAGAGMFLMAALGVAGVKAVVKASQAQQARLDGVIDQNAGWSRTPLHAPDSHLYNGSRGWSAYGRNENGVVWELCLSTHEESPDQLSFRTPELKLERLELVICNKTDIAQLAELLPKLDGILNSFVGKMMSKMINALTSRLGIQLEDLVSFMKSAEERPAGSAAFQAKHSVLTRGSLPLEKLITPEVEGIITELDRRKFALRWGTTGLIISIQCSRGEVPTFAPILVRLGTLLTPGAG